MRPPALAAALVLAAAASAAAAPAPISATGAWSRPAAAGGTAAGFLILVNPGGADALVGAESPIAQRVEIHASSMAGGMMQMQAEPATPLPARGKVSFAPGGRHLMFVGLKRALHVGDHVPATLTFRSGARLKVDFVVNPTPPAAESGYMRHTH
jgi:copper(I)-binding protein